jgi:predicted esterase
MSAVWGNIARCCLIVLALALPARAAELQPHVTFMQSTPLASGKELLRRAFTPLTAGPAQGIAGLPLDVALESFAVYVPATKPPNGYALLVFVPPWNGAEIPVGWSTVFDDDGVIFVSANDSGNDKQVRTRRMPLALIAAQNIMRQYPVDPSHVFVAGFSGGSKVALRLALAYPDLFRGAFLNSGSNPIGTSEVPLPPADLFRQFQTSSRIFYVTGDLDRVPFNMDRASAQSLSEFCVAHVTMVTMWHTAHESANESTLSEVLDALLQPAPSQPDTMADCRANLDKDVQAQLRQVQALIASGDKAGARQLLQTVDAKYGGLAAPQSLALDAELH